MKRILFLILLLLFQLKIAWSEPWQVKVDEKNNVVVASKNGEVTHGDKLRFRLLKGKCDIVQEYFTFHTILKNPNIKSLKEAVIPIEVNGKKIYSKAMYAIPFLMGHSVWFFNGGYNVEKHIKFYENIKVHRIKILSNDGSIKNFKVEDYFDIIHNEWNVQNVKNVLLEAKDKCEKLSVQTKKIKLESDDIKKKDSSTGAKKIKGLFGYDFGISANDIPKEYIIKKTYDEKEIEGIKEQRMILTMFVKKIQDYELIPKKYRSDDVNFTMLFFTPDTQKLMTITGAAQRHAKDFSLSECLKFIDSFMIVTNGNSFSEKYKLKVKKNGSNEVNLENEFNEVSATCEEMDKEPLKGRIIMKIVIQDNEIFNKHLIELQRGSHGRKSSELLSIECKQISSSLGKFNENKKYFHAIDLKNKIVLNEVDTPKGTDLIVKPNVYHWISDKKFVDDMNLKFINKKMALEILKINHFLNRKTGEMTKEILWLVNGKEEGITESYSCIETNKNKF